MNLWARVSHDGNLVFLRFKVTEVGSKKIIVEGNVYSKSLMHYVIFIQTLINFRINILNEGVIKGD